MVQMLLDFIRAEREGSLSLNLSSFAKMLPWVASYDHINFFRWGDIYIYVIDMHRLKNTVTAHDIYKEFTEGNFV